jgi:thiamine biosynthesis lipoprotein
VAGRELIEPIGFERRVFRAMGTSVTVLLPAGSIRLAEPVADLFVGWDLALSRFRPESELSGLNAAAGREARVSPLLFEVATASLEAARATDGLFDPTVGSRMVELGYDRTFAALPADRPPAPVSSWVPGRWRAVRLDGRSRTVTLPEGAAIDLGGIAKGMAVDASIRLLAAEGVTAAAVNAGGDLAVLGRPGELPAWTIQIEGPTEDVEGPVVAVTSGGLATSSVGRRRWLVGGRPVHHLIDPRDGLPVRTGVRSASVLAASCVAAEVAAKVALILGVEDGGAFLRRHGLEGVFVAEDGHVTAVDRSSAARLTVGNLA